MIRGGAASGTENTEDPMHPGGVEYTETQIGVWRDYVKGRAAFSAADVDELESHLRDRIDGLRASGLSDDEAFLIAVKRLGGIDELSHEFALAHSERLWKQLVLGDDAPSAIRRHGLGLAALVALAAALWVKLPAIVGIDRAPFSEFFFAGAPVLFLLPVACYLLIRRRSGWRTALVTLTPFATVAALLGAYPFEAFGMTQVLAVLHAAAVLWIATGVAYANGDAGSQPVRMDFIRFTGEWIVYVTLLLIGGVLLAAIAASAFSMTGIDLSDFIGSWLAPCGTAAALVVGAWLVEEKQSVIENIAPVLTKLFTPLFAVVLLALVAASIVQRDLVGGDRELLIVFDVVLIAAVALLLYSLSARDPERPAGWFEGLQLAMVVAALIVDVIVLAAMIGRIGEYGMSANKLASLGVNLIMLANLAGAAWLQLRFLRGRSGFGALERWQTSFLPVYLGWAAVVVIAFPPVFGFV